MAPQLVARWLINGHANKAEICTTPVPNEAGSGLCSEYLVLHANGELFDFPLQAKFPSFRYDK